MKRCGWVSDDIHIKYHDTEWGVPLHNDRKLFEFLVLDAMQSGLSWRIVLNKRTAFKKAFENFVPKKILLPPSPVSLSVIWRIDVFGRKKFVSTAFVTKINVEIDLKQKSVGRSTLFNLI